MGACWGLAKNGAGRKVGAGSSGPRSHLGGSTEATKVLRKNHWLEGIHTGEGDSKDALAVLLGRSTLNNHNHTVGVLRVWVSVH